MHLKALTINGLRTTNTFLHAFLVLVREPLAPVLTLVVLGSLLLVFVVVCLRSETETLAFWRLYQNDAITI